MEITLFAGRSETTKRHLYGAVTRNLEKLGISSNDVTIVLYEIPLINWGLRGLPATAVDVGFPIEV